MPRLCRPTLVAAALVIALLSVNGHAARAAQSQGSWVAQRGESDTSRDDLDAWQQQQPDEQRMQRDGQQRQLLQQGFDHHLPLMVQRARSCRPSFEPTCEMYPYIRYWNRRFSERDCQHSPLRHPQGSLAPLEQRKYVVFQPDAAQWNNIRMAAEVVIQFALVTGRTLVMPAMSMHHLHVRSGEQQQTEIQDTLFGGPNGFFDFSRISEAIDVITMEDFLATVAATGLLKKPLPTDVPIRDFVHRNELWAYLEQACYWREWDTEKTFIAFNFTAPPPFSATKFPDVEAGSSVDPVTRTILHPIIKDERVKRFSVHKDPDTVREPIAYDAAFHAERAIYFPGEKARVLAVWYSFLYFANPAVERQYRRVARDRLRAQDGLMCAAGRMIRAIHLEAAELANAPTRPPPRADAAGGSEGKARRLMRAEAPAAAGPEVWAMEYGTLAAAWEQEQEDEAENKRRLLTAAAHAAGEREEGAVGRVPSLSGSGGGGSRKLAAGAASSTAGRELGQNDAASGGGSSLAGHAPSLAGAPGFVSRTHVTRNLAQATWNHALEPGRNILQPPQKGNPQTLGGDTNFDATYHALHIRRRDFKFSYKETYIPEDELYNNISPLLNRSVTRLLYIATDEQNRTYFKPFEQDFEVRYLSDYVEKASLTQYVPVHMHIGFLEQMVCANAHTFVGTPLSTFSGYITRLRGFYRDNRYANTFYSLPHRMHQLHERPELYAPFWAREWSIAHMNIDDHDK